MEVVLNNTGNTTPGQLVLGTDVFESGPADYVWVKLIHPDKEPVGLLVKRAELVAAIRAFENPAQPLSDRLKETKST